MVRRFVGTPKKRFFRTVKHKGPVDWKSTLSPKKAFPLLFLSSFRVFGAVLPHS